MLEEDYNELLSHIIKYNYILNEEYEEDDVVNKLMEKLEGHNDVKKEEEEEEKKQNKEEKKKNKEEKKKNKEEKKSWLNKKLKKIYNNRAKNLNNLSAKMKDPFGKDEVKKKQIIKNLQKYRKNPKNESNN